MALLHAVTQSPSLLSSCGSVSWVFRIFDILSTELVEGERSKTMCVTILFIMDHNLTKRPSPPTPSSTLLYPWAHLLQKRPENVVYDPQRRRRLGTGEPKQSPVCNSMSKSLRFLHHT